MLFYYSEKLYFETSLSVHDWQYLTECSRQIKVLHV